jgi:hypothetical protein
MKLALRVVPKGLQERAQPLVARGERFLKEFEWTWTKAVVVSLTLWFVGIWLIAFIPSWWLYFASDRLGWRPCPCSGSTHWNFVLFELAVPKFWLFKLRDVVASLLFGIPFGGFVVVPFWLQKVRRRLRSESESRPIGGYR